MRVAGVDAWRRGWVAVSLEVPEPAVTGGNTDRLCPVVRAGASLARVLSGTGVDVVGIDMPLGLLEAGWREADRTARGLLGPRRSSVFAIPPRAVWAEPTYLAANQRCRELTGQGLSVQAWCLRPKLLEANAYRETCAHDLYEVHPELAFGAMAGAPLTYSKHTAPGRELRRELLARAGIMVSAIMVSAGPSGAAPTVRPAPEADTLDAAAVAWSAWRIASGRAVTVPGEPQHDSRGLEIAIRY